ncbi:MAG: hypothetical protein LKM45_02500 [Wolbachia endosymbiont of Alcedoecus sp.]|nr:hypothetical protein [Wolbachia endosymbiont of Alcedoecus sp.]
MAEVKENPIVTLKAQAKKFDFSKLRAAEDNKGANSGEAMYLDFPRMNFVINGKKIDKNLILTLKKGAEDYKSELFSKDGIYNPESSKKREIDTEQGRTFVDSVLKKLAGWLAQDALSELWNDHCKNPETADQQKTDAYKKEFEKFYNAGQKHKHLLPKEEDKNYRPFVKEVFKRMFEYAGAAVPSDSILEELVTNCNQAGYEAATYTDIGATLTQHSFLPGSLERVMKIDCTDQNNVKIRSDLEMPIYVLRRDGQLGEKAFDLPSSLKFTLNSQDGKDGITYKDGKLSLTVPRELENYHATNEEKQLQSDGAVKKSLLDVVIEFFLILIEKFVGIKLKNKRGIYNEIKNTLHHSNSSEAIVIKDTGLSPIKIECSLGEPLKVNSHLESVEPPIHFNKHVHSS